MHVPAASTDGDVLVFFRSSDVIAAGDIYSTVALSAHRPAARRQRQRRDRGAEPADRPGHLRAVHRRRHAHRARPRPHQRRVRRRRVPRHGDHRPRPRRRDDQKGLTLDQVKAARPTLDWEPRYGSTTGPWTTAMFVEAVYRSLRQRAGSDAHTVARIAVRSRSRWLTAGAGIAGVGAVRHHRQLQRALPRRPARADAGAFARRLPRPADQRERAGVRRGLGRVASDGARASVPGALIAVHPARPVEHADLGGTPSRDAAGRGHSPRHQQLSAAADGVDGRPAPSVGARRTHVDGLFDRPLGGRHAGRHDQPHQADVASPQRRSAERPGHADRALQRCTGR